MRLEESIAFYDEVTVIEIFQASTVNGSYYLKLTYTGHNYEVPPPTTQTIGITHDIFENFNVETPSRTDATSHTMPILNTGEYDEINVNTPYWAVHGGGATRFIRYVKV